MTVTRDWSTNGIDVVSDGGASGDGLSFMEVDGVLAARTVGRTDVTPDTARALAAALTRWAEERDPTPTPPTAVQWGVRYPQANGKVVICVDEEEARKKSRLPYYVTHSLKDKRDDAEPVGRVIANPGPWINMDALMETLEP